MEPIFRFKGRIVLKNNVRIIKNYKELVELLLWKFLCILLESVKYVFGFGYINKIFV